MPTVLRSVLAHAVALAAFITVAILLRGSSISVWTFINPDEAELVAQARAALLSPAPFSTWTSGTTGPFWVLFLALLGFLGFPMTLAFAHLLSAVLTGAIGYLVWVLFRRSFGLLGGWVIGALWWTPLALIYPLGALNNFGALSTEYLPAVFLLLSAIVPQRLLDSHPGLLIVAGLFAGLAIGAKYQVLPVALALVFVQMFVSNAGRNSRAWFERIALWTLGVAIPFILVGLLMVLSRATSWDLLGQNLTFLGSYASRVTLWERTTNTAWLLLTQPYFWIVLSGLIVLAFFSSRRVLIARTVVVLAGLMAVFAGGMGFGHYLILLYVSFALAASFPISNPLFSRAPNWIRPVAVSVSALLILTLVVVGAVIGKTERTTLTEVRQSLSASSVVKEARLQELCPEDSPVLVWGWAPELYVAYSWRNSVPFMNTLGIASDSNSRRAGAQIVAQAIAGSDCVIDAVGYPFFGVGPESALTKVYPTLGESLSSDFRKVDGVISCRDCSVYVREN